MDQRAPVSRLDDRVLRVLARHARHRRVRVVCAEVGADGAAWVEHRSCACACHLLAALLKPELWEQTRCSADALAPSCGTLALTTKEAVLVSSGDLTSRGDKPCSRLRIDRGAVLSWAVLRRKGVLLERVAAAERVGRDGEGREKKSCRRRRDCGERTRERPCSRAETARCCARVRVATGTSLRRTDIAFLRSHLARTGEAIDPILVTMNLPLPGRCALPLPRVGRRGSTSKRSTTRRVAPR